LIFFIISEFFVTYKGVAAKAALAVAQAQQQTHRNMTFHYMWYQFNILAQNIDAFPMDVWGKIKI